MKSSNFKIEALATRDGWITRGEVYEFKNGYTIWDDGCKSSEYVNYKDLVDSLGKHIRFKEYGNTNESIIIYKKDNEIIAIKKENGQPVKSSKAKCHPNDNFDFETGAKIAFDRLVGCDIETNKIHKKENYLKLVFHNEKYYGRVGKPTIYKDDFGKELFVGDQVLIVSEFGDTGENIMVSENNNDDFIMGIEVCCKRKTGVFEGYKVIKIKGYEDLKVGDSFTGSITCEMN